MNDSEKIHRGNRARELLDDELLREAFAAIEGDAQDQLLAAGPLDDALRRAMADRINAIRNVKAALQSVLITGKTAALRNAQA